MDYSRLINDTSTLRKNPLSRSRTDVSAVSFNIVAETGIDLHCEDVLLSDIESRCSDPDSRCKIVE